MVYFSALRLLVIAAVTITQPVASEVAVTIAPSDPNIQYIGRFQTAPDGSKQFDMPGCEIRFKLSLSKSTNVSVSLAQRKEPVPPNPQGNTKNSGFEANAFNVWIDGVLQGAGNFNSTFTTGSIVDSNAVDYQIGNGLLTAGTHTIRIFKATEADWNGGDPVPNYVTFYGINAAGASTVAGNELPTRKIEFLGDSITAGFCNECKTPDVDQFSHQEAHFATWDHQICELLNAQCHTAAWSGLGMVRNCCGGNTTMPSIFNRTLATDQTSSWDFLSWRADALVINLGTNDGGAATDPKYTYVQTYTDVIMQASHFYGPDLQVFLACGPMATGYCDPVNNVIKAVSSKGVKAHFLDQRGFLNGTFGPACCGHPSIEVDSAMAKYGAASIKSALGW